METIELKLPDVTVDDVLAGEKEITVATRRGETRQIKVKAMNWRTALLVAESSIAGQASEQILKTCLSKDQSRDEFLDELLPAHLFWIQTIAMWLSNGVTAVKKRQEAKPDTALPG